MLKLNDEELKDFLSDKPFYKNDDCYCLGKTLEEAGEIFRKIMEGRERANVGVAESKGE